MTSAIAAGRTRQQQTGSDRNERAVRKETAMRATARQRARSQARTSMMIIKGPDPELGSPAEARAADLRQRRQLEESVSWSGRERLKCLWHRLRLTVAEMNHATRRLVELQAPWIVKGHQELPGDGHEICPLVAIRSAR